MKPGIKTISALLLNLMLAACSVSSPASDTNLQGRLEDEQTEVIVSAAASLTDALNELKTAFEQDHPAITLSFNLGGSGKLAQQIRQGAPVDLFLSASQQVMDRLEEEQLILPQSRFNFAGNSLVLITSASHPAEITSFGELYDSSLQHIAVGEPETVPAGHYTKEVLGHLQLWEKLSDRLIFASDVRQVLTFTETGNVEAGVVYASDAAQSDKVIVLDTANPDWHSPIVYPAATVAASKHPEAAQSFLDYLSSRKGKQILQEFGFQ